MQICFQAKTTFQYYDQQQQQHEPLRFVSILELRGRRDERGVIILNVLQFQIQSRYC